MNDTGSSGFGSNPASLKGKLQTLEVLLPKLRLKLKIFLLSLTIIRKKSRF